MGKSLGGIGLILLSLFMAMGFTTVDFKGNLVAVLIAFFCTVLMPAGGGMALLRSLKHERQSFQKHRDRLRRQTLEAEIVRMAERKGGSLLEAEIFTETGFDRKDITFALESLVTSGIADIKMTEEGINHRWSPRRSVSKARGQSPN